MAALVVVTVVLPSVPSDILPYLESLFRVFCRLAKFLTDKYAGRSHEPCCMLLQVIVLVKLALHGKKSYYTVMDAQLTIV